ncbi:demethylmenaquinone methyltransferase [Desulfosporosinus acididurans]|uniref:Demethylmenaquinone methyltransferase n=1 Tax=Desulfosporosinus acididurans TaxID=476652 RepID=A0A0J1FTT9_9FIRM|nr:class I SAM-dependent methyltransferase [Desulfosporosinus acididurans]KLU66403.1 demethylmenaquinone methyltransferase [Desulfosporosinus acididurans]
MNTVWSKNIFGIETLIKIRDFRFNVRFSRLYLEALPIRCGMKLLDLGCGPGSFTRCVCDWFGGDLQVEGIDLDSGFIDFCIETAAKNHYNIAYNVCDACNTPFPDESFDITTSYTVAQHVENTSFFQEQYRLLKHGGYIVVMDVGEYVENIESQLEVIPMAQEELYILLALQIIDEHNKLKAERFNKHKHSDDETKKLLKDIGFTDIQHRKIKISGSPDNQQSNDFSRLIIDNFYCSYIDLAISVLNNDNSEAIKQLANRYIDLVNERKAKRIEMYENNKKVWDSIETEVNIIVGKK